MIAEVRKSLELAGREKDEDRVVGEARERGEEKLVESCLAAAVVVEQRSSEGSRVLLAEAADARTVWMTTITQACEVLGCSKGTVDTKRIKDEMSLEKRWSVACLSLTTSSSAGPRRSVPSRHREGCHSAPTLLVLTCFASLDCIFQYVLSCCLAFLQRGIHGAVSGLARLCKLST